MANPYNDPRYGGALSATRGFLDAFKEYQKMRFDMRQAEITNQYRQSIISANVARAEEHGRKRTMFEELSPEEQKVATFPSLRPQVPTVQIFTPGQTQSIEEGISYMLNAAGEKTGFFGGKKVSREDAKGIYNLAKTKYGGQVKSPEQFDAIFDSVAEGQGAFGIPEVDWDATDPEIQALRGRQEDFIGPQEGPVTTPSKKGFFERMREGVRSITPGLFQRKTEGKGVATPRKYGPVRRIPGEKEPVFGEIPFGQPDFARIEQVLGKENAQMEQKAWQTIYDTWRFFPKQLQDAIRAKQQQGVPFTEIMQFDEVDQALQKLVK